VRIQAHKVGFSVLRSRSVDGFLLVSREILESGLDLAFFNEVDNRWNNLATNIVLEVI
jgi:hypothetical protein